MYTRRKERELHLKSQTTSDATTTTKEHVKFPSEESCLKSLEKMPLFSRAQMDNHIKNSGKNIANKDNHSIPMGLRKAKTFLDDEYLSEIRCSNDQRYFYVKAQCCHSFRKNEPPHDLKIALCIISGDVERCVCTCVAGNVGYCNHILALMFKLCKFTLFDCKSTDDLSNDADQQATLACTSQLQQWHKKGGGSNIHSQPVMEVIVNKTKLDEEFKSTSSGIKSTLYEARMKVVHNISAEQTLKRELSLLDPNMGLSQMLNDHPRETVDTKFGKCQVGSALSYQAGFTESNFKVSASIECVPRLLVANDFNELVFPRFPLVNLNSNMQIPSDISDDERLLIDRLQVDETDINKIEMETRKQSDCPKWKDERKYRFTASNFHLISRRQRNHDSFAESILNPKAFSSKYVIHGKKFEPVALAQYHKYMFQRKTPVQVLPSGFVVSKECPILGASPDARIVDTGCTDHFGLAEVKCPQTKFHVTPLDACSDPTFCMEKTSDTECSLKKNHAYYAQVQGQMGVTGAKYCDFIVYTNVGMYIQRIPFDYGYWNELKEKLTTYYFKNFLKFAAVEFKKTVS